MTAQPSRRFAQARTIGRRGCPIRELGPWGVGVVRSDYLAEVRARCGRRPTSCGRTPRSRRPSTAGPCSGSSSSPTPSTASSRSAPSSRPRRRPAARSRPMTTGPARCSSSPRRPGSPTSCDLPEGDDLGAAVDAAMKAIEAHNPELQDVLPKGYQRLEKSTLVELLRLFAPLPRKLSGDAFGLIYEDFLSNFAMAEGRLGGEFFTPYSIVRLIVEIIEPFHGRVFDPACGSGGMFVQCAKFVERHTGLGHPGAVDLRPGAEGGHGPARQDEPRPARPVRRHPPRQQLLRRPARQRRRASTSSWPIRRSTSTGSTRTKLEGDKRFPFGLPKPDNANYLWIQLFYSALDRQGPRRVRHGQLRGRRRALRAGDPPQAHRVEAPST